MWKLLVLPTFCCGNRFHHSTPAVRSLAKDIAVSTPSEHLGRLVLPQCLPKQQTSLPRAIHAFPSRIQAGRKGGWISTRVSRVSQNVALHTLRPKETAQGETGWAVNELNQQKWSSAVVSEEMLWNLCFCAITFLAKPAPALTPEIWEQELVLQSPSWKCSHLPELGIIQSTPSSHCNTKLNLLENGSMAIFGVNRITFQVLVYFNFKVLGITEAGCFGLTIMQLECWSKGPARVSENLALKFIGKRAKSIGSKEIVLQNWLTVRRNNKINEAFQKSWQILYYLLLKCTFLGEKRE